MVKDELVSVIRFGVFEVDPRSGELRKHGVRVRLREQSFQVLTLLLERAGQVVTREELQRQLWAVDTFVDFDRGLNKAVNRLRDALGDSADSPRFIETLPKRGYRFIAPVERVATASLPQPSAIESERTAATAPAPSATIATPVARWRPRESWIAAAVVVIVSVAAASYMLITRRPRMPTEPARVVLADFDNHTGDTAFDDTLREALAIDLEQSPVVRVVSGDEVVQTLRLMHRRPDERITTDLARDVCRRTHGQAVLGGSLALLNTEYVLSLNAIDCQNGGTLGRKQVRAFRKEDVLTALDDASSDLRRRLGESSSSIQRFDKHIHEMLSTSSLAAFQAYTNGERNAVTKAGWSAIPFFQRAIDLDPDFAYAHAAIGLVLGNSGDIARSTAHTERAYQLRDRVTEWERFFITVQYYRRVTGELEKVPAVCDLWIQAYPQDRTGHNQLATTYGELGQPARALVEYEQARRVGHEHPIDIDRWAETAMKLDRVQEAAALTRKALEEHPDRLGFRRDLHRADFLLGDMTEMTTQLEWAAHTPGAEAMFADQSEVDAYFGLVEKARASIQRAILAAARNDFMGSAAVWSALDGVRNALVGNVDDARRRVREARELEDSWETRALAALALARVGDLHQAREVAEKLHAERPLSTLVQNYWLPIIRAEVALHDNHAASAIDLLRDTEPYELADTRLPLLPAYVRGHAYLQARDGRAAAAEFQKLLQHRGMVGASLLGALAHLGRARALVLTGDTVSGRGEYEMFLNLWKGADSTTPVLAEAKAEYEAINAGR